MLGAVAETVRPPKERLPRLRGDVGNEAAQCCVDGSDQHSALVRLREMRLRLHHSSADESAERLDGLARLALRWMAAQRPTWYSVRMATTEDDDTRTVLLAVALAFTLALALALWH
jgi:hypothetical protein